tara:strand:- start:462 stop:671 length:210 start_codon:yes stop_codon:yes gene_type:complete
MTTLVLNYSRNLFDLIGEIFSSLGTAIRVSRQIEANQKIARMLRHEYPNEDYNGILAILNDKTLREYYK